MKINFTHCFLIIAFSFFGLNTTFAKKVKFAVDMRGQVISPNGIHASGNFQTLAGFPGGDWNSATTKLMPEAQDSNIFSIVVDIPAHRKYEFKFVNGDMFYEVEFVPEESRVGHDFNDNRWFYLDSLTNDTTLIGVLPFGANAPDGKMLLRLKVDVKNQASIDPTGIYVAGTFNNFSYTSAKMYSFTGNAFEYYTYVDSGTTINYRFANGNDSSKAEVVMGNCATNNLREILVNQHTVLDSVCFATCTLCQLVGVETTISFNNFKVFPNPATNFIFIENSTITGPFTIQLFDIWGKEILNQITTQNQTISLNRNLLNNGVYLVKINCTGKTFTQKLILH